MLGNKIGTDATGTLDLGNGGSGVWIEGGIRTEVGNQSEAGSNTIAVQHERRRDRGERHGNAIK